MAGLLLGPIVGHTDDTSTRIWIQVADDPSLYELRIHGRGRTPFVGTEGDAPEFGTALAIASGLRADCAYGYQVLRLGRVVRGAHGSFRTMPSPGSFAPVSFVVASCSDQVEPGAWPQLEDFVEKANPRFLLLIGDQIYMDQSDDGDVWEKQLSAAPNVRRQAMAAKYAANWGRDAPANILASVPTYMLWDDHDIRNGWGSLAPDSPTLGALYPRGAKLAQRHNAFFEDARDVYWHFQMCHNPLAGSVAGFPNPVQGRPGAGERVAMPYIFRCGRFAVLVLDSRGARDLWRDSYPVLGEAQWNFIDSAIAQLPPDVDGLVVVTSTPIASVSPDGQMQFVLGSRTDDVDFLERGDAAGIRSLIEGTGDIGTLQEAADAGGALLGAWVNARFGSSLNLGGFKLGELSDVRDQWSHHLSRTEQERVIRTATAARSVNRLAVLPRGIVFVGGDIHAGAVFDVTVANDDEVHMPLLVSSGIGRHTDPSDPLIGTLVDDEFEVASGITSSLQQIVNNYNFGLVELVPTGGVPFVNVAVLHQGATTVTGARATAAV
jgi:hypothetical protein